MLFDYCASFYQKGKLKALKILSNSEEFQDMFISLGDDCDLQDIQLLVEKFVCKMYCQKKLTSVDEVRADMFLKKYKPGSSLPP